METGKWVISHLAGRGQKFSLASLEFLGGLVLQELSGKRALLQDWIFEIKSWRSWYPGVRSYKNSWSSMYDILLCWIVEVCLRVCL